MLFQIMIFTGVFVIVIQEELCFFAIFGGKIVKLVLMYLLPNIVINVFVVNAYGKQGLMVCILQAVEVSLERCMIGTN
ncbi:hypothetical protein PHJA_002892200 [Phtheirospermum japonicum]|uniref:Uncharacterized protein n=1 Tax=Phtheirospermum japonicum TaxID=374723 RepID=A0A830D5W5_9LAMI|nr:hypothetical protein PHJA_002892200 [Phtheirospermum japonicum]